MNLPVFADGKLAATEVHVVAGSLPIPIGRPASMLMGAAIDVQDTRIKWTNAGVGLDLTVVERGHVAFVGATEDRVKAY